jgi:hypothetical protein
MFELTRPGRILTFSKMFIMNKFYQKEAANLVAVRSQTHMFDGRATRVGAYKNMQSQLNMILWPGMGQVF